MKLFKVKNGVFIEHKGELYQKNIEDWDAYINRDSLYLFLKKEIESLRPVKKESDSKFNELSAMAPIGSQELWAAGVTYLRSREARMEESEDSGGADFYDKVYEADRPELFFKAMANRIVGTNEHLFIRKDSSWNVPEPELTLFVNSKGSIEAYTIGNDMSSRSIEGENPLYLPQAKVFERCAALGPCLYVPQEPISPKTCIEIQITRSGAVMYQDQICIDQIKRKFEDLVKYLFRECDFHKGCFLMTGTGLVPPDDFTLRVGDQVKIEIDNIGTLVNTIHQKI